MNNINGMSWTLYFYNDNLPAYTEIINCHSGNYTDNVQTVEKSFCEFDLLISQQAEKNAFLLLKHNY